MSEPGLSELIPGRDTTRPRLSNVSLSRQRARARAHRRIRVRFTVSERSRVRVRIERCGRGRWAGLNSFTRRYAAGAAGLSFSTHPLRAGRYRAVVRAQDGAHNRSRRVARRFRLN